MKDVLPGIRRLAKLIVSAAIVLPYLGVAYAGVAVVLPSDQRTSCGTPMDPVSDGFPCGEVHLGPGLGTIPGIPGVVEQRAAAEFPISGIVGLRNATLVLNAVRVSTYPTLLGEPVIEFRGYEGDGSISASDVSAGVFLFSAPFPNPAAVYSFDVTTFVSEALGHEWSYVGFSLRDVAFGSVIAFIPGASGNGNYLQIAADSVSPIPVPEPSSYALMLAALAMLIVSARHTSSLS